MLVFAGVVKKCLQHEHSFRLASVWLKSENLRFACTVTRFCSSKVKKKHEKSMIFNHPNHIRPTFTHPVFFVFSTLQYQSACGNWQGRSQRLQQGSIVTPCPAVQVGASVSFFVHLLISLWSIDTGRVFPCSIYLLSTSNNGSIGFTPQTTWKMISLSKDMLFVVDLGHLESFVGITLGTKIGSRKKSNKSASESMCNMSTTATCSVT